MNPSVALGLDDIPLQHPLAPDNCALNGIRLAILGAWPPHHDPTSGHLFSAPADAAPLSSRQITALRAFRLSQSEYIALCKEPLVPRPAPPVQVIAPSAVEGRKIVARLAVALVRRRCSENEIRWYLLQEALTINLIPEHAEQIAQWAQRVVAEETANAAA